MIHTYKYCLERVGDVGEVKEIKDTIVKVVGLEKGSIGEGITFEDERHGEIITVNKEFAEVIVYSREKVKMNTKAARTGNPITISAGEGILGHTLDAFGYIKDERRGKSDFPEKRPVIIPPKGIPERKQVTRFMQTGVSIVDLLLPIGKGQRSLVVGDRKTGKTWFLLQTVITQASLGKVCVYGAIGKRKSEIKEIESILKAYKVMDRCVIVAADGNDSPGEIYISPYTAMTVAEYFRDKGTDVLLILDDMTTHAKYYREISLVSGFFPGKESYPGDMFYIHSRILERSGCFNVNGKEASITCLPAAESMEGDITGYVQTNLMSMTDGHLFFDKELFLEGRRPAINIFLSVTRVGKQTQTKLTRDVAEEVLKTLIKHRDLQRYLRFGQELSEMNRSIIDVGNSLLDLFNQVGYKYFHPNVQLILISLIWTGFLTVDKADVFMKQYQKNYRLKNMVNKLIDESDSFYTLINKTKMSSSNLISKMGK